MPGRRASLIPKSVIWICWPQLRGIPAQPSCGGNTPIHTSMARIDTFTHYTWMGSKSMPTVTKIHALPRGEATHWTSEVPRLDGLSSPKSLQRGFPRPALFEAKAQLALCCGTSNSLRSVVPSFVNDRGCMADRASVLGRNTFLTKLSTGRAGINASGDAGIRQHEGPRIESVGRTVAAYLNCRHSPKFWKNRCSTHSRDSLFGSAIHNNYQCSPTMKDINATAGLRRKEGSFSNVARLRSHGGAVAENFVVAPVEVIRPNAAVKNGPLPVRCINPGAKPKLRLIHETAILHPDALLGEGVEIGAFCTVGPQVRIGNGCKLQPSCHIFGETQLGDNCVLSTGAVVGADIPGYTIIGDNNIIGHYAVVGVKCQDMKYKEGDECFLYVGNNNDIREFASVHRSSKPNDNTVVGNDNLIMGYCHVAHDCKIGNGNILANGTLLGGHVVVEDLVHTGGGVAVHQFCHIDSYAFLGGGSMVDRDVPMYMMVAGDRAELRGLNLEGMRRCGFSDLEIRSVRKAYQKLFMNSRTSGGLEQRLLDLELEEDLAAVPAVSLMLQSVRNCFGENRRGMCKFKLWASV